MQMRWDDSLGYAASDLDLYLRDSTGEIVATSEDYQKGIFGDVPYELLWFTPAERGTFSIEVELSSGRKPGWVQLVSWNSSSFEHRTISGSITNPAESVNPGLLAVGASSLVLHERNRVFQQPRTADRRQPEAGHSRRGRRIVRRIR